MDLSLHNKQGDALLTSATEVLYGGAAGGGKSHLMRTAALSWAVNVPGIQIYLFRRTSPDLLKNHMLGPTAFPAMLASWIKAGYVKMNFNAPVQIHFVNGSKIHLCHCQHIRDMYGFAGAEIHALLIDELTTFPEIIYRFLRGRCRLGGLKIPDAALYEFPRILCGANPGGIGHNWVKAQFVDMAPPYQVTQMAAAEGGMKRAFIPALLEDNPTLVENDPGYGEKLEGLGDPALVRAMRLGDWDVVYGGMFDDLWARPIHVMPAFPIPKTWRLDRSFDWGSSTPFSVGWWAESDGSDIVFEDGTSCPTIRGDVFRVAEWYGWNGNTNQGLKMIAGDVAKKILEKEASLFPGRKVVPGPADTSIYSVVNGKSIADDMAAKGCHWTRADKTSNAQGWETVRKYLKGTLGDDDPGLYIFENCTQFIRTFPLIQRKDGDEDDIAGGQEDHVADETKYRLHQKRGLSGEGRLGGTY